MPNTMALRTGGCLRSPPRLFRQPQKLLLAIVVVFCWTSWWSFRRLPVPVPRPAFDSGFLTPKHLRNGLVKVPPAAQILSNSTRSGGVCEGYEGVLHIQSGDAGGAAGTIFFIYVVNQLLYAERYNLLPWIHLNNVSRHVFDQNVHSRGGEIKFEMMHGMTIDFTNAGRRSQIGMGSFAGAPKKLLDDQPLSPKPYTVSGTGVWSHYFEPVSKFDFSCHDKPLLRMHYYHLNPGMLLYCPWSVKSWPYNGLLKRLSPSRDLKDWYKPMRESGSRIVKKYFRFREHIVEQAENLIGDKAGTCLAMHIRHSDKGGTNRKQITLESFLPYAEAYLDGGGSSIFLATDSSTVISRISKEWPARISRAVIRQSDDMLRSSDRKAVFQLGENSHDRTNREVLIDILALSRCKFFLHGFSAVSEAVMYLNFDLHNHSVDLESHPSNRPMSASEFRDMVRGSL